MTQIETISYILLAAVFFGICIPLYFIRKRTQTPVVDPDQTIWQHVKHTNVPMDDVVKAGFPNLVLAIDAQHRAATEHGRKLRSKVKYTPAKAAKIKSVDIYFHAGGIFPGVPEKTAFAAKAEQQVRDFCKAHTGAGSGQAFVDCFADRPDVYFNEAMLAKSVGKEAIKEFIDSLPGQVELTPLEIFVATDETKVASLIEVKLPDGNSMEAVQFATLEAETAKYITIDVFWHAGGVFPDVPERSPFSTSAEMAISAFAKAHTGGGSGGAVGECFTDESNGIYWNEAFVPGMKPTTKQGLVDLFNNFPPGISLEPLLKIVSTDETQVAALMEVTLPDGNKMKAIDWVVVEQSMAV